MIGTLDDVRKDIEHGLYDNTENGKCTGCGQCCGNILPLSKNEIVTIRNYIKEHGITEQKHGLVLANKVFDMTCPFLDESKKKDKCVIYSVRPGICRNFNCSKHGRMMEKDKKALFNSLRFPVDVRATFF